MNGRCIHLGDVIEVLADAVPERTALVAGPAERTYAELDERATRLANHLASHGIGPGDRVAIHARNGVEWVEGFYACCKLRAVPVGVNHRYLEAELAHVYDDSACVAVLTEPEFEGVVATIASVRPRLRHVLVAGPGYERALAVASPVRSFAPRSPDDLFLVYTGGTTGAPKGVMWRQEDVVLGAMNAARLGAPLHHVEQLGAEARAAPGQARHLVLGPLMHAGGQWAMGGVHLVGGLAVLSTERSFGARAALELAARRHVQSIGVIGDAMARPLAEAIALARADGLDLSSLFSIGNGGSPLSAAVCEELRRALPSVVIVDSYGATETGVIGTRRDDGSDALAPRFATGPDVVVLDDEGEECATGVVGFVARTGHIPLGYLGDPAGTAVTFRSIRGRRWVLPGDLARREEDGTITLIGRGSSSIDSGGEKVHPEEVEEVLGRHADVLDAMVVGTPSPRWGEQVTALVQPRLGRRLEPAALVEHCRGLLADFKVPKTVLVVDAVPRTSLGKADRTRARSIAVERLDDMAGEADR